MITSPTAPVLSVIVDYASVDGRTPPPLEGVLIVRLRGTNQYRVTAPVNLLVRWVAEVYVEVDTELAELVEAVFESAEFGKIMTAFSG